ncbi:MAG: L-seryl-tRNA selenium transferase [Rhodospirillaceae bacterium]|nr:L-seryl-tRNA selenium transferase [Rhodospirillaceae bacterium]
MSISTLLEVLPIINAAGPVTRLSGSLMSDEVVAAMAEAAQACYDIAELQAAAGSLISDITGAESGYVTSGASAGLLLGVAACVTGLDPGAMNRLPDASGLRNQVIMPRSHRNFYDHAIRSVGIELIEVGISDRYSGAGVRDTEAWEIEAAITEQTAAVAYVANANAQPPLPEVTAAAHKHAIPVIVDAAGQLPPSSNLKRFIAEGADLVCFSGGKVIGGPQGTGIIAGRRELISSVALQHLDQDVHFDLWSPPEDLIDKRRLPGAPQHGIGRPCKVGKEQIAGLVTALKQFVDADESARREGWLSTVNEIADGLRQINDAEVRVSDGGAIPSVQIRIASVDGMTLMKRLNAHMPSVHANASRVHEDTIVLNPVCLRDGDVGLLVQAFKDVSHPE